MEVSNQGTSFYHRFRSSFYNPSNALSLSCSEMSQSLCSIPQHANNIHKKHPPPSPSSPDGSRYVAINGSYTHNEHNKTAIDAFFANLILSQTSFQQTHPIQHTPESITLATKIVNLFDSYLRYHGGINDQWESHGREYFTHRVRHFTAQNAPIEFCLPAFPCKSSNLDKVTGTDPDKGEEIALERLHSFIEAVDGIYEPGGRLWIISDGHVFSDCIGVDDCTVDAYGEKLRRMSHAIGLRKGKPDRVVFRSLVDLFQLGTVRQGKEESGLVQQLDNLPPVTHYLETRMTDEAELCRRILMAGCGPSRTAVRARIESNDSAITALYRGFSRFMLEDLELHSLSRTRTRSQQKKLATKVAFEMILRNQAYSNLVELLFPHHVRLSIHAHNNAGPKFGIRLFDPSRVKAVKDLTVGSELEASPDLLHIPTPWHNCIVQLGGQDVFFLTKAKVARAALVSGVVTGKLAGMDEGSAYFALERRTITVLSSVSLATPAVASADSITVLEAAGGRHINGFRVHMGDKAENEDDGVTAGGRFGIGMPRTGTPVTAVPALSAIGDC